MRPPDSPSGQARLPWRFVPGPRARAVMRLTAKPARWRWGEYSAKPCPRCACDPDHPCTMVFPDGLSTAQCVPAGAYDLRACSRCLAGMPRDGELLADRLERAAARAGAL